MTNNPPTPGPYNPVRRTPWKRDPDEMPVNAGGVVLVPDSLDERVAAAESTAANAAAALTTTGYGTTTGPAAKTGCLTIIDDDGETAVTTRLAPIFAARGIPGSCAIITGNVGQPGYMDWAAIETLIAAGWEMLGHGDTYVNNLTEHTTTQLAADFTKCRDDLRAHGAQPVGFVYPENTSNAAIRAEMREHFAFAFGGAGINQTPVKTDQLQRIGFGAWTTSNPTISGNAEKSTLAYYQACVDYAVANDSWLVLMTHVAQQDAAADTMLGTLLDYAASAGLPVVTPSEGYRMHGNRLWAGDSGGKWTAVTDDGIYGADLHPSLRAAPNSVPLLTAPTDYRTGTTAMMVTAAWASAQGFPSVPGDLAGTLFTSTPGPDFGGNWWLWTRQEYYAYPIGRVYMRTAASETTWNAWVELITTTNVVARVAATNAKLASDPPSAYPVNTVTVVPNNTGSGAGFPVVAAGLTTTYRVGGQGWDRQEWRPYNNHGLWSRYSVAGDTWSAWVKLSVV